MSYFYLVDGLSSRNVGHILNNLRFQLANKTREQYQKPGYAVLHRGRGVGPRFVMRGEEKAYPEICRSDEKSLVPLAWEI